MKKKQNKWLRFSGIVFALAMLFGLMPIMGTKAYAQKATAATVKMEYPVGGETDFRDLGSLSTADLKKTGAKDSEVYWYSPQYGSGTQDLKNAQKDSDYIANNAYSYNLQLVLIYDGKTDADSVPTTGWKMQFETPGYEPSANLVKTVAASNVKVDKMYDDTYWVTINFTLGNAAWRVKNLNWNWSSNWASVKDGTKPEEYFVTYKSSNQDGDKYSFKDIVWYEDEGMTKQVKKTDALKGGQYYYIKVPIVMGRLPGAFRDYVLPDDESLLGHIPNQNANFVDVLYSGTMYTQVYEIPVVKTFDSISVKGIQTPVTGNKPKTEGITLSCPQANTYCEAELLKAEWKGKLDDYGNFLPGEHYSLVISYCIDIDNVLYDIDMKKPLAKEKISVDAGVVESNTVEEEIWYRQFLTVGFNTPFEVSFDANSGSGTMKKVQAGADGKFVLPECGFTAPAGYVFDKWDLGAAGSTVTLTKNTTIKALWKDAKTGAPKDPIVAPTGPAAAGDVITDTQGKAQYTVITPAAGSQNGIVEYKNSTDASAAQIEIPDTVTIGGITYKVESVAVGALKGNSAVTKVIIGKNVKTIGDSAFEGCTALKEVNCKSTVLSKIGKAAFKGDKKLVKMTLKTKKLKKKSVGKDAIKNTGKKLTIKVPKKCKKSYKTIFKSKGNKKVKVK